VADLGCGAGPLGRKLFQAFPSSKGTLLDYSEPMLDSARSEFKRELEEGRVQIIQADLSTADWKVSLNPAKERFDVVVSGFAIHHLPDDRKREIYLEIYELLSPGGVFLNLEHVASSTKTVEGVFDGAFVESMYQYYQGTKTTEECEAAVYYDLSVDQDANILAPVEAQCDWLREIGYQHVDCYFKFLILALFGGVKGGTK
jgi:ubiquinone/menaquinone biosynthesis C-methylase UbiE